MSDSFVGPRAITEFAKRTGVVNLDVSLVQILEGVEILEKGLSGRDPSTVAGWFVYSPGYAIIVGHNPRQLEIQAQRLVDSIAQRAIALDKFQAMKD